MRIKDDITWRADILDGNLLVSNRAMFRRHVRSLEGKRCELVLREYREPRADPLRKYYFKFVASVIAAETGHTKEEIHESMKSMFNSHEDEFGILIVEPVFRRSSLLSDMDKINFISTVRNWAKDNLDIATQPYGGVE